MLIDSPPTMTGSSDPAAAERPRVAYCGFSNTENVGDYALYKANIQLFPGLSIVERDDPSAIAGLFGGGTGYPYSLEYGKFPRRPTNVAIGLGVEDPAFVGRFGPLTVLRMYRWRFRVFGVRGFRSKRILARYGLTSFVTGDTALAFERPPGVAPADRVGICLVGEAMARLGNPTIVQASAEALGQRVLAEGLVPVVVPFCRRDLPHALALQAALGGATELLDFWSGALAEDLSRFLAEFSRLRFVVGERLHGAVLAAAMDVPFVALPYKPKCLDFAESLDDGGSPLVLEYSALSAETLWERVKRGLRSGPVDEVIASVGAYRQKLRQTAADIECLLNPPQR